jgi:hypothetical protein
MTSAAAFSLDRPRQSLAVVEVERPLVVPAAANDRRGALLSDFARAMRQVEAEVYGLD